MFKNQNAKITLKFLESEKTFAVSCKKEKEKHTKKLLP